MGTLGDGIGNAGDSVAVTRRMRTAPLWGLRSRNLLFHDGRTTDRGAAIAAHNGGANGQGTAAATRTTRSARRRRATCWRSLPRSKKESERGDRSSSTSLERAGVRAGLARGDARRERQGEGRPRESNRSFGRSAFVCGAAFFYARAKEDRVCAVTLCAPIRTHGPDRRLPGTVMPPFGVTGAARFASRSTPPVCPHNGKPEEVRMLKRTLTILWAATAMGAVGCGQNADDVQSTEGAVIGDALPGTNAAAFAAAKANFELTETVQDGAGPIFNERSCSACHSNTATGGAGQNIERRYGRVVNGAVRRDGEHRRLAAPALRSRRLQSEPGPQLPVGHRRAARRGDDPRQRPPDHAALRPGPGRLAARPVASTRWPAASRRRSAASSTA